MEYLAHSSKENFPPQTYAAHVSGVRSRAEQYSAEAAQYAVRGGSMLENVTRSAAYLHDLGKLDSKNQAVLHGETKAHHLPLNHVDAGTAELLEKGCLYPALIVHSHHQGLPNCSSLGASENPLRDECSQTRKHVDASLPELMQLHTNLVPQHVDLQPDVRYEGDQQTFFRMALSCLADADHTDTAAVYGQTPESEAMPLLRAAERLDALNRYVENLGGNNLQSERNHLRRQMYETCRDSEPGQKVRITTCDSPVGSGKTTAVMAYMLRQAAEHGARRIFVVLPYTNIIRQSVDVYRKALCLPGENPVEVVSELHCRADFQDFNIRYLTALWRAPIIVTTAVAFFETLASNRPSALRRLHELPGSLIFVDEAHNALPIHLLPLAWRWMNVLAEEWDCRWVLASGSLVRFWQLNSLKHQKDLEIANPPVAELVPEKLRNKLMAYEKDRVTFKWIEKPLSCPELISKVQSSPGPRLLIMNTVRNAAVIAEEISKKYGRQHVEHLSTALTAEDRTAVIECIKRRLKQKDDKDWTLVATSCVEAGVDFSFASGFREMASLVSLLQAAGRVNRHGENSGAEIWSFSMQDDSKLNENPALKESIQVLEDYFKNGVQIRPDLSTRSMDDQIIRNDGCMEQIRKFCDLEKNMEFESLEKNFRVIDSNTILAVADQDVIRQIQEGKCDWRVLQQKSVSVNLCNIKNWSMKEIVEGIYQWTLDYDDFLGYMRGVLDAENEFL
jgi:CRISPR-associated endonuclease/helicase Cas3